MTSRKIANINPPDSSPLDKNLLEFTNIAEFDKIAIIAKIPKIPEICQNCRY